MIRHALFSAPVRVDRLRSLPWVTYTDPELAQVGMLRTRRARMPGSSGCCARPTARTTARRPTGATNGHIKVITDRPGDILGATIVGAEAGENIAAWTLAINQKLNIEAIAGVIVPYPTYAEVGKRAAMTYFTRV